MPSPLANNTHMVLHVTANSHTEASQHEGGLGTSLSRLLLLMRVKNLNLIDLACNV